MKNPFKPSAGATPPLLVGRENVLEEFEESLDDGPGAPARLATFTGPRGVGKTVLLTEARARAAARGWHSISETATPGMGNRLALALTKISSDLGFIGGEIVPLRDSFNQLLDQLKGSQHGLLVTVDEVHTAAREDMRDLTATYQHLVTEDRNVSLVMAGLPAAVSELLQDDVLTFLRRATPFVLTDVPLASVKEDFLEVITQAGRQITEEALDAITQATGGYPFMVQLVGYHVWRKANGDLIDIQAARLGIPAAQMRLGSTVHATALADLSDIDRTYLVAMAQDDGPSLTSEIARRMDVGTNYTSVYRTRLIAAGVIRAAGHGHVDFAIPFLREYLRDHAAHIEMTKRHV